MDLTALVNVILTHSLDVIIVSIALDYSIGRWFTHRERIEAEHTKQTALQCGINPYLYETQEEDDDDEEEEEEIQKTPKQEQPVSQYEGYQAQTM
jgi:hypothetical protein